MESKIELIEAFYNLALDNNAVSATIISNPSSPMLMFTISIQTMIYAMRESV